MVSETKKIIEISFLPQKEKEALFKMLESEGETDALFQEFSNLLVKEIEQRSKKYQATMKELETQIAQIEKTTNQEKEKINRQLAEHLTKAGADLDKKQKTWEEYYAAISELQSKHEKKLKEASIKIVTSVVTEF